jgi:hypothetical protein
MTLTVLRRRCLLFHGLFFDINSFHSLDHFIDGLLNFLNRRGMVLLYLCFLCLLSSLSLSLLLVLVLQCLGSSIVILEQESDRQLVAIDVQPVLAFVGFVAGPNATIFGKLENKGSILTNLQVAIEARATSQSDWLSCKCSKATRETWWT